MNLLDENITRDQVDLLRGWGLAVRTLAGDLGLQGILDDQIIPLLLGLKRPTLLTRDRDFFDSSLLHARYALVWLDVGADESAFFIRRLLRHPLFKTQAQRLGKVVRVRPDGISYWRKGRRPLEETRWVD